MAEAMSAAADAFLAPKRRLVRYGVTCVTRLT
jgi:hypothetical protein